MVDIYVPDSTVEPDCILKPVVMEEYVSELPSWLWAVDDANAQNEDIPDTDYARVFEAEFRQARAMATMSLCRAPFYLAKVVPLAKWSMQPSLDDELTMNLSLSRRSGIDVPKYVEVIQELCLIKIPVDMKAHHVHFQMDASLCGDLNTVTVATF